jgi:hypothetical protein
MLLSATTKAATHKHNNNNNKNSKNRGCTLFGQKTAVVKVDDEN